MSVESETDVPDLESLLAAGLGAGIAPVNPGEEARLRMRRQVLERVRGAASASIQTLAVHDARWSTLSPLVDFVVLRDAPAARQHSMLVRLKPGGEFPAHWHPREEETLVLEGEVQVGKDRLRAGDYQYAPAGSYHEATRSDAGATILLRYEPA